ncbi:hypothetical protein [Paraburkholderia hospita]|uniref:hypothetical protein n=1 Tax=Paraburkholderia hospita TaxID=169430 RepID=UPI001F6155B1|nr:hypothetical protein [Paraburkholderia hospita]
MKTQTQYLSMVFDEDTARFPGHLLAGTEAAFCPAVRSTSQIVRVEYLAGYRLTASTGRTGAGLYPANLLVERPGNRIDAFHTLEYFHDAGQAVLYAAEWGRRWVQQ